MSSQLIRPYDRSSYMVDVITPTDVHAWAAAEGRRTEQEWQARERVLDDQVADVDAERRVDRWLTIVGGQVAMWAAPVSVLAFTLTYGPTPAGVVPEHNGGPWWAILVGILTAFLACAGLAACWMGAADWRSSRIKARVAERALREHRLAYVERG